MSTDICMQLELLRSRIHKKEILPDYDMVIVDNARMELLRLRKKEAILEIELMKKQSTESKGDQS